MKNFLLTCLLTLSIWALRAQAASESAYSDQSFDPTANGSWYQSPILLTAFILLVGTGGYLWYKRRR